MGRAPCCDRAAVKRGPWSPEEDDALRDYIQRHGTGGSWITLPKKAGLRRCGKSCRLRWLNYLRPDIRHGGFTDEEDAIIFSLYRELGSKWSLIASQLERRTDNDVKNHWNTHIKKKLIKMGIDPVTHQPLANTMAASPVGTTSQSTAMTESATSRDTINRLDSNGAMSMPTDSSDQSSRNTRGHDEDPLANLLLEEELPVDGPWFNFASYNDDDFSSIAGPLLWDGTTDWLLDYQDIGLGYSSLVDNPSVHS